MKKTIALVLLILLLALSFTACGENEEEAIDKAEQSAKEYCKMLDDQREEIQNITFTGKTREEEDAYYFQVEVEFEDTTRPGEVECIKNSDGGYDIGGLNFTD